MIASMFVRFLHDSIAVTLFVRSLGSCSQCCHLVPAGLPQHLYFRKVDRHIFVWFMELADGVTESRTSNWGSRYLLVAR